MPKHITINNFVTANHYVSLLVACKTDWSLEVLKEL